MTLSDTHPPAQRTRATTIGHFSVALTLGPDRTRLHLRGELDAAAAPVLQESFDKACVADNTSIVFDLHELAYSDSSGLRILLQAAAHCAKTDTDMHVVGAHGIVRRLIELTHTADALNLQDHDQTHPR